MPIRNVKIYSSKETKIAFGKVYVKRAAVAGTTEAAHAECTTAAIEATTAGHKKRAAVIAHETTTAVMCAAETTTHCISETTETATAHHRRKKRAVSDTGTTHAATDGETTHGVSCEATTICIPKQRVTEAAAHRRKRAAVDPHADPHATYAVECVTIPTPDPDFQNFSIIMVVILSCIFAALFVIYYFCTKDLVIETYDKAKNFKN